MTLQCSVERSGVRRVSGHLILPREPFAMRRLLLEGREKEKREELYAHKVPVLFRLSLLCTGLTLVASLRALTA